MQLTGLFIYPIKACAGIALERAEVVHTGLALDRRYMLVDQHGNFVTQRQVARLCLVRTALSEAGIVVSSPGHAELQLPRELSPASFEPRPFQIWRDAGQGLRHPQGSAWFSQFLGQPVSLLYMPDAAARQVNPARARPGDHVGFADGYPLLLISQASLDDLNHRLDEALEMRRFRPNLVIDGCEPFAEDGFGSFQIGALGFRGVKRCDRCVVTTIDPDTGKGGKEPLRTLAQYRQEGGKVWFGMNVIHDGPGWLRLGDRLSLAQGQ